ncbi:competence protein ComEA helix-hairpin-helix repeat protein [hydrothermal vent metagenome]|uniref:Competence protein ComEA helix-hairpin-helix repeat protein n=1 Tax=hydrothermal vent metagenome TaxID=652676 RepID=A0A3B0ZBT2_9ZZZZ
MNVLNLLRKVILISSLIVVAGFSQAAPVNINTADAATLAENISGIGPKKAQAIVTYRKTNGPFKNVQELTNVKGIGQKTLEKNMDDLLISSASQKMTKKKTSKN